MKKFLTLSMTAVLLSSCSLMPDYQRPQADMPTAWRAGEATEATKIAQDWWSGFNSTELNTLMAEALRHNNDIQASLQRIEQSRAALKIAGAPLLPSADAFASASRDRFDPASGRRTNSTDLQAGAGISYEVDLFGANRATQTAAQANFLGSQYDMEAVRLIIMGDVAQTYFNVLNARERLRIADENLSNAREVLRIVQARFDAGTASALEVAQQKTDLGVTEASRATIAQQIIVSENALGVILGKPPQIVVVKESNLTGLHIPTIEPGQPSRLLERRPDIRAAEADLMAANANIGVARAAFFPKLSIGVDAAIGSTGFGDPASSLISLAGSMTAPLFQGGRLEGGLEQATAQQAELVYTYRKTILVAFQDVEDAQAAIKSAQFRETSLAQAAEQARLAYDLSRARYEAGTIDFLTLLQAQNARLIAEDSYAQARLDRLSAALDLFKALGGGWV